MTAAADQTQCPLRAFAARRGQIFYIRICRLPQENFRLRNQCAETVSFLACFG